jgi:hypothetical protein
LESEHTAKLGVHMRCSYCDGKISEDNYRTISDDQIICDYCFEDYFCYCERCDEIINRENSHTDENGTRYCVECYDETEDPNCPNNPEVDETDRMEILSLSRNWLLNRKNCKRNLSIKSGDLQLKEIKELIGLVDHPIHIYGLRDREEYQLTVTKNLEIKVNEYITENNLDWKIKVMDEGESRMGLSLNLRLNLKDKLIELIKSITTTKVLA